MKKALAQKSVHQDGVQVALTLLTRTVLSEQAARTQYRKMWTRLGSRLLATMALIAFITGIALVTAHRARSAGSAVPVQVTGTPNVQVTNKAVPVDVVGTPTVQVGNATLATSNINEPAKQPFQRNVSVHLANGESSNSLSASVAVPAGKRLVVEAVSMYRSSDSSSLTPNQSVQIFISANMNGTTNSFPLPYVPATTADYPGITQPMRFYADGGTNINVYAFRTGTSGGEDDMLAISGYLVNVP